MLLALTISLAWYWWILIAIGAVVGIVVAVAIVFNIYLMCAFYSIWK